MGAARFSQIVKECKRTFTLSGKTATNLAARSLGVRRLACWSRRDARF